LRVAPEATTAWVAALVSDSELPAPSVNVTVRLMASPTSVAVSV
jgi:hypothetical protein